MIELVKEILKERKVLYYDGTKTLIRSTETGTPQGSIASPLIWNIGANDLLNSMEENSLISIMYADDQIGILFSNNIRSLERKVEKYMKLMLNWCFFSWSSF